MVSEAISDNGDISLTGTVFANQQNPGSLIETVERYLLLFNKPVTPGEGFSSPKNKLLAVGAIDFRPFDHMFGNFPLLMTDLHEIGV